MPGCLAFMSHLPADRFTVCIDIRVLRMPSLIRSTYFSEQLFSKMRCHLWEIRGVPGLLHILDVENLVAQLQRHTSRYVPLSFSLKL
jgi:hypothetical protein